MTILLYDDIYLEHDTGAHPENAERLRRSVKLMKKEGLWERCEAMAPRDATPEEICRVHDAGYVQEVEELANDGGGMLDMDTIVSRGSYAAAVRAAGALLEAADRLAAKDATNALCLVRPPGHHALKDQGMGFCLLNNVAIATRHLTERHGLERVMIVDWDVHHGNGTQAIFYDDPSVTYISFHRYPFFPGTGSAEECGTGRGEGFTVNVPFPWNLPREEYLKTFERVVKEQVGAFRPQAILISAGFDAYVEDPIAGLGLEIEDFGKLTRIVCAAAAETCAGFIISSLEGGYNLDALPRCLAVHLRELLAATAPSDLSAKKEMNDEEGIDRG